MKLFALKMAVAAFAAAAMTAPVVAQNLLQNDSFETPDASPPPGYVENPTPPGVVPPWVANNVDVVSNTFFGAGFARAGGTQVLDLVGIGSSGSIYQEFATVANQVYSFSFYYSNNFQGAPATATATATIADATNLGNPLLLTTGALTHTGAVSGNAAWSLYTGTFTAVSALTRLTFTGTGSNNGGIVIDDVSVSAAPEPGAWAMMILGFGVAGTALRTRRRRLVAA